MSLNFTAAHSSRITKPRSKNPFRKRPSSSVSPFSSLPRQKPLTRPNSKTQTSKSYSEDDEDFFQDRLDDVGLVTALATDPSLRDVPQLIKYTRDQMFDPIPERAPGMNSTRIAAVLNYRTMLPPTIEISHLHALVRSGTELEREIAELVAKGVVRRVNVPRRGKGQGALGEGIVTWADWEACIRRSETLSEDLKSNFIALLCNNPTAMNLSATEFSPKDATALMNAGFLVFAHQDLSSANDYFTHPAPGSVGTSTSLLSISRAASGSIAAVGGEDAIHGAGGGSGSITHAQSTQSFRLSLPNTGPLLRLLATARSHLLSLLARKHSKYRELPLWLLKERWDGAAATNDNGKRIRGEFAGVLPGKTQKWKSYYGLKAEWVVEEAVGAGLVEVFDTGSVGWGVRVV
ncbi:MAG: hypothetical protein M1834_006214 [Cirrosporium novae-zelandiae]|nr:MAG: hypothetical protein M1834_006214 [Cirrosporium novae-zelandiae]